MIGESGGEPESAETVSVVLDNRQGTHQLDSERYAQLLRSSLAHCGVEPPAEVGLAFIGADEMTELNVAHMGGAGPTDVLSFPIDGGDGGPPGQPALVGDIVLCPAVAARAPQPLADEIALLVVHGALHLLGHDHVEPEQSAQMKSYEAELLGAYWREPTCGSGSLREPA